METLRYRVEVCNARKGVAAKMLAPPKIWRNSRRLYFVICCTGYTFYTCYTLCIYMLPNRLLWVNSNSIASHQCPEVDISQIIEFVPLSWTKQKVLLDFRVLFNRPTCGRLFSKSNGAFPGSGSVAVFVGWLPEPHPAQTAGEPPPCPRMLHW